jgi:sterol desaturase/sphingolipid hydroxylase (fatty acid hydroxylase superfamily)
MSKYLDIFLQSFSGYWNYLLSEILNPSWHNYFYWLIALSVVVWLLELIVPWRKSQSFIRKDFWMDAFYMFFNFFLFSLVLYNGVSNVAVNLFHDLLAGLGITNIVAIEISSWPVWVQLLFVFVIADFIQWNIHRMLHRNKKLWEFHKVHHSVKEMGFAAHLRFHWMETVVYKSILYIPLSMIGFGIDDFFIVHIISVAIGHLNHANIGWDYGPFKYVFNNPKMHIWHHAKVLPKNHSHGMNFGISLSVWDYLFKTAYIPSNGKNIELGFPGDNEFPATFGQQVIYPLNKTNENT